MFPSFSNLPAQVRMVLKDDIISTAVQNLNELSQVPKEWQANVGKNVVTFNKIY